MGRRTVFHRSPNGSRVRSPLGAFMGSAKTVSLGSVRISVSIAGVLDYNLDTKEFTEITGGISSQESYGGGPVYRQYCAVSPSRVLVVAGIESSSPEHLELRFMDYGGDSFGWGIVEVPPIVADVFVSGSNYIACNLSENRIVAFRELGNFTSPNRLDNTAYGWDGYSFSTSNYRTPNVVSNSVCGVSENGFIYAAGIRLYYGEMSGNTIGNPTYVYLVTSIPGGNTNTAQFSVVCCLSENLFAAVYYLNNKDWYLQAYSIVAQEIVPVGSAAFVGDSSRVSHRCSITSISESAILLCLADRQGNGTGINKISEYSFMGSGWMEVHTEASEFRNMQCLTYFPLGYSTANEILGPGAVIMPYGSTKGGQSVAVTGSGFSPSATVEFGGEPATDVVVVDTRTITCTTPAHVAGIVDVEIIDTAGTVVAVDGYEYEDLSITSVSPDSGPFEGGGIVGIEGTGFTEDTDVSFGGEPSPSVTFINSRNLVCTVPAAPSGDAVVDVAVTDGSESDALVGGYTYESGGE